MAVAWVKSYHAKFNEQITQLVKLLSQLNSVVYTVK
jgi:hypothetical protein